MALYERGSSDAALPTTYPLQRIVQLAFYGEKSTSPATQKRSVQQQEEERKASLDNVTTRMRGTIDVFSKRIRELDAQVASREAQKVSCAYRLQYARQPAQRNVILREAADLQRQIASLQAQRESQRSQQALLEQTQSTARNMQSLTETMGAVSETTHLLQTMSRNSDPRHLQNVMQDHRDIQRQLHSTERIMNDALRESEETAREQDEERGDALDLSSIEAELCSSSYLAASAEPPTWTPTVTHYERYAPASPASINTGRVAAPAADSTTGLLSRLGRIPPVRQAAHYTPM